MSTKDSNASVMQLFNGQLAKLVDALDLGSSGATLESSSLSLATKFKRSIRRLVLAPLLQGGTRKVRFLHRAPTMESDL